MSSSADKAINLIKKLRFYTQEFPEPLINSLIKEFGKDPFLILIGCLMSLRVRDTQTAKVCSILFKQARTPEQIYRMSLADLEKILHPLGFYKRKAKILHDVSGEIIKRFHGRVPDNKADLLSIKGVGHKTANLVLGMAFGIPAICVDTHVHKISNKLGLVKTRTPDQTEKALERIVPKKYWIEFNTLLVKWGQNSCTHFVPSCPRCSVLLEI